jgi:hypothetical protein
MALPRPDGNRARRLFPSLLLGLSAKMNLDRDVAANRLVSSGLIFLLNLSAVRFRISSP